MEEGSIKASYINTKDQLADLLTKPLGKTGFNSPTRRRTRLRGRMMDKSLWGCCMVVIKDSILD